MPKKTKKWNSELKKWEVTHLPTSKLKDVDPERYQAVVQLLKEGVALKAIQRATGTSTSTLYKMMDEDPGLNKGNDALLGKLRRHAFHALDRLNEVLEEDPDSVPYKSAAISMGIATDKYLAMSQTLPPQSLHVTQINVNEVASLNDLIANLPRAKPKEGSSPSPAGPEAIDVQEVS